VSQRDLVQVDKLSVTIVTLGAALAGCRASGLKLAADINLASEHARTKLGWAVEDAIGVCEEGKRARERAGKPNQTPGQNASSSTTGREKQLLCPSEQRWIYWYYITGLNLISVAA
jgi:hypothetical protein